MILAVILLKFFSSALFSFYTMLVTIVSVQVPCSPRLLLSLLVLASSPRGCSGVRGEGGVFCAPCWAPVTEREAET